jgi:hypothetical protein
VLGEPVTMDVAPGGTTARIAKLAGDLEDRITERLNPLRLVSSQHLFATDRYRLAIDES